MGKKYWFYIEPFVHLVMKKDSLLLYNTYTGKILEYKGNVEILKLGKRLLAPRNLRVILLEETKINQPGIHGFIAEIREHYMGDLLDVSYSQGKPVLMPPIVKNQMEVKYLIEGEDRSTGEDIMAYLTEVTLYLNDYCGQGCFVCREAFKQFLCCTAKNRGNKELQLEQIRGFFSEIKTSNLARVNICGGDILAYREWEGLIPVLKSLSCEKHYYLHYLNLLEHKNRLENFTAENSLLTIIVDVPMPEDKFCAALEAARQWIAGIKVMFIIRDSGDFEAAESLAATYGIENTAYIPFYDGNNLPFFEQNLFITREELEGYRISAREIYTRGVVNPLDFGRLVIFPDGDVYANVNDPALGNLGKDSLYNLLSKELVNGKSWRKTRKKVKPCRSCLFSELCPPISNYSRHIKRYNFCTLYNPPFHFS